MGSDVVLSAGVRQNLLALQNTAKLMSTTQNRLATGKKVNSALDNPVNFFTSAGLQSRARDLNALLDAMSNGVKTLEAADNGISAITRTIESMQSTLLQARQDKSFKSASYAVDLGAIPAATQDLSFTGGAVGTTPVDVDLTRAQGRLTGAAFTDMDFNNAGVFGASLTFNIAANGGTARTIVVTATNDTTLSVTVDGGAATTTTIADADIVTEDDLVAALNAAFDAAATPVAITASVSGGAVRFEADTATDDSVAAVTVTNVVASGAPVVANNFGFAAGGTAAIFNVTAKTVDQIVTSVNANASLTGRVRATNDNGELRIENLSTSVLTLTGVNGSGDIDGGVGTTTIGGNEVRSNLATQFDQLRDQLNKLADDASYNGINLLHGDVLKLVFNETSTSIIEIQSRDQNGDAFPINASTLGISFLVAADLDSDTQIDGYLNDLAEALGTIRSQASNFGSNLSIVQNRQDFTKAMINTLQTGADNLVLADTNEEGANMLALQTRQQLSTTALSLASQADQNVLRLFG
jgi:flagellin